MLRTRRRVEFVNSSNTVQAKTKLERRGVQDLSTAIAHAKDLIDFSTRRDSSKLKDKKVNQEKARDCPKKASLNGMSAHKDEEASEGGSMATINGVKVHALVDFGATHNFVADDEAKRLGINATKGSGTIKVVNSPAKAIHGVAKDVQAKIGE
ncbi:putative retrotransposon gag domain, aspartic peptidase domain protein [Tanacetum coccineum]